MKETQLPSPDFVSAKMVTRTVIRTRKATSSPSEPQKLRDSISANDLPSFIESFLIVGDISRHSVTTLESRRYRLGRLVWLAERRAWKSIGIRELQAFFLYLNHGHEDELGRWDNPQQETKVVKPGTAETFHMQIPPIMFTISRLGITCGGNG